nr:harbinger transposase-derived nuclease domain-containing protein [Tanacetum cinerariifolium]
MDHEQQLCLVIMVYFYFRYFLPRNLKRKRANISTISGKEFTLELLRGNNKQCIEFLRMSHEAYVRLIAHFRAAGLLKESEHVSVEEKLGIFLFIIGGNRRCAAVKQRFQLSTETINKIFSEVMVAMRKFAREVITPTSHNSSLDLTGTNKRLR